MHEISSPVAHNVLFNSLIPLIPTVDLACAKPDAYHGSAPQCLDLAVRNQLQSTIQPSRIDNAPILPNFALEVKGPGGTSDVLKRQATYDGALMARGVQAAEQFAHADEGLFSEKAHTFTSTYLCGTLTIYAHHLSRPGNVDDPVQTAVRPMFHMTQVGGYCITGSRDQYQQGVTAYRNAIELTSEYRDSLIKAANRRSRMAKCEADPSKPTTDSAQPGTLEDSDSSADELSLDYQPAKRRATAPKTR